MFPKEKNSWTEREQKLVDWYLSLKGSDLPVPPFKIVPHITVTGDKFYLNIEECILNDGPNSAYSRLGYLEDNLEKLHQYMKVL